MAFPRSIRRRSAAVMAAGVAVVMAGSACSPFVTTTDTVKSSSAHVGTPTKATPVKRSTMPAKQPVKILSPSTPTSTALAPVGVPGSWTMQASDEFNGTSLNSAMWSVGEPWNAAPGFVQGDDSYCSMPYGDLVTEGGGSLQLNAKAAPKAGKPLQSCFITSRDKYSFTHGYLEARVKVPSSPGLWSSFWLLGNGVGAQGWPGTGEIDLFEFVNNGHENGVPYFTVHYASDKCSWGHCQQTQDSPYPAPLADYAGRWITYGLLRTSTSLTIYIDGQPKETFTRTMKNGFGVQLGSVLFDNPMHVRFDLSAGGWAKDASTVSQPGTFSIDYVRAWTSAATN
jgi:beta-glucanase (GH16 family)